MESAAEIRARLEAAYRHIEKARMQGVPILNPALEVRAIGFEPHGGWHLGILITPWFMNLLLLPRVREEGGEVRVPPVGEKMPVALPCGQIEFIAGHEEEIGAWLACSLFSPMFEFADQEAAEQAACAALDEILNGAAPEGPEDPGMAAIWAGRLPEAPADRDQEPPQAREGARGPMSRRDFLRGGAQSREPAGAGAAEEAS